MERNAQRDLHAAFWRSSGGFDLVLGPVIMSLGGLWIDRRLDTAPVFMIALLLFGAAGAATKVYYDWKRGMDAAAEERDRLLAEAEALRAEARAASPSAPSRAPVGEGADV